MTEKRKRIPLGAILTSIKASSLHMELKKGVRGAVMVVGGIMGVREFTDGTVVLVSHGGILTVRGECLQLSTLEGRTVEIYGKILGVELGYGKA